MENLENLLNEVKEALNSVNDIQTLNDIKVKYMGKKGLINDLTSTLRDLSIEEKKVFGAKLNELKMSVTNLLEEKKKEIEKKQLDEKVKLAQAELINYRKRKDEETATMLKYANADLILELIPSIDNFERAIKQAEKSENTEIKKFMTGINLIYQGIQNTLTKFGVEEINRVGQEYDPNLEQALLTDCVEEQEDEVVLEVLQKGYKLKDRVIRAASVKINQK